MSKHRSSRIPEKAELGRWNFLASEFRDHRTMWLVKCDCGRITEWRQPCTLKSSKMCRRCADEQRKATFALGKKMRKEKVLEVILPPVEEQRAPQGQMSVAALAETTILKKAFEKASPSMKAMVQEACDAINVVYEHDTDPFPILKEQEEKEKKEYAKAIMQSCNKAALNPQACDRVTKVNVALNTVGVKEASSRKEWEKAFKSLEDREDQCIERIEQAKNELIDIQAEKLRLAKK